MVNAMRVKCECGEVFETAEAESAIIEGDYGVHCPNCNVWHDIKKLYMYRWMK